MTASAILERTRLEEVRVVHVEDDEDWQSLVQKVVDEAVQGAHYELIQTSVSDGIAAILSFSQQNTNSLTVGIFDLRMRIPSSDADSISSILDNIDSLLARNIPVFVLSGNLSVVLGAVLGRKGVRVLTKGEDWSDSLGKALQELTSDFYSKGRNFGSHPREPVYGVEAKFEAVSSPSSSDSSQLSRLSILITGKHALAHRGNLAGRGVVWHVMGVGYKIDNPRVAAPLPPAGEVAELQFWVSETPGFLGTRRLWVLGFHKNHMVCYLELPA